MRAAATTSASGSPRRSSSAGASAAAKDRFRGRIAEGRAPSRATARDGVGAARGPRAAVLCPQTFYNDAGRSVGPARGAFKLPLERVLVVHDEIDLPFAEVRTRLGGGLAGNNGLKSIKRELGGADFIRVRVGVGRPESSDPEIVAAYVLGRFRESEAEVAGLIEEALAQVERAVLGGDDGAPAPATPAPTRGRPRDGRRGAALRTLLGLIEDDEAALRLAREGGHAYVSSSLRPYLIAALAEIDEAARARPTLVVVGDDRAARDLAGDLRGWLAPRRVRYYPSRGVAYESHLAPPAHLVGLRVAALDALLGADAADRDATGAGARGDGGPAGGRRQRDGAVGEGARPGAAPALVHAARR